MEALQMLCKLLLEHGEFELYSWNFLENFLLNIFNLLLVESADVEPTDTGGQLYLLPMIKFEFSNDN